MIALPRVADMVYLLLEDAIIRKLLVVFNAGVFNAGIT